ncbi:MAG: alpha/beta hydrolase [Kiritimatiellae bacterium]|nr:alpha/beta hydrolase [Kiritimatiellia bacterium]
MALLASLLRIACGVGVGLILLTLFMYVRQASYVYFPDKTVAMTPEDEGLAHEEITLSTDDGERLQAWFVPASRPRATLLFCHGNAGNIGDRLDSILTFNRLGLNVFIFDYRGYGNSTGKPTEDGTYRDALAAWRYVTETRNVAADRVIIFGRSLGGAVGAWLAVERQPGALILESTFTSMPDIGAEAYPFLPVRLLCRFKYETVKRIGRVRCPVLIAHSIEDEMIAFRHGQTLYAAAPQPKQFLEMRGMHNDGPAACRAAYRKGLEAFVTAHFGAGG